MSDQQKIIEAVNLAIKTADYNKSNNTLRPDNEAELIKMEREIGEKVAELQKGQAKINTFLSDVSAEKKRDKAQERSKNVRF